MPRQKAFDQINIMKDAMYLFWKRGFYHTSIQDLVKYLGINRASLYDTYGDKETLFIRCFEMYKKEKIALVGDIFKKHEDPKKGLKKLFEFVLNTICSDPEKKGEFISNTLSEIAPNNSNINLYLEKTKDEAIQLLESYLKKGQAKGYISPEKNIKGIAHSIMATAIGSTMLSRIGKPSQKLKENLFNNLDIILS